MKSRTSKIKHLKSIAAFSLIEILIAVVLVGVSITALVAASSAFTMANGSAADLSTAEFLVEQIREMTTLLPVSDPDVVNWMTFGPEEGTLGGYDDVDDLDGASFSPPVNANRETLSVFGAFQQQVTVQNLSISDFDTVVADRSSPFVRVQVNVLQNGVPVCSASWIRARH